MNCYSEVRFAMVRISYLNNKGKIESQEIGICIRSKFKAYEIPTNDLISLANERNT